MVAGDTRRNTPVNMDHDDGYGLIKYLKRRKRKTKILTSTASSRGVKDRSKNRSLPTRQLIEKNKKQKQPKNPAKPGAGVCRHGA